MGIEYIGAFQVVLGVVVRFWPVWLALALVLGLSFFYKKSSASTASFSTAASASPA